jgi:hypothetical protein
MCNVSHQHEAAALVDMCSLRVETIPNMQDTSPHMGRLRAQNPTFLLLPPPAVLCTFIHTSLMHCECKLRCTDQRWREGGCQGRKT